MQGTINGQLASKLAPMDTAYIYDTKANTWTQQALNPATTSAGSRFPSTVSGHSATLTSDGKIMVFGGDNAGGIRTKQFLNTLVILDTNTWTWTIPLIDGIPPSRRSNGVAAILDGKHLTVAFGEALNTNYNDINVFDPTSVSWLQSYSAVNSSTGSVSTGVIAGVTVAGVVLLAILLFLLWRFQSYVRWLFRRIHSDIWKPRTGEPVWAETTRIVFQIAFLFLFTAFLVFVIKQTIDSPNITQRIEKPTAQVETPDVRFCFDGYPTYGPQDPRTPGVVCQTNSGYSCNRFITPLDMNVFQPTFSDNLGPVSCFLFRSDSTFKLTSTSGDNNGSTLAFTFLGDQSISYGRVHVSVFPKTMDPNVVVYGISDDVPVVIPSADVLNWMNAERNDIEATNVYTIEPFAYSTMNYDQISEYQLQPAGWNYVGFLSIYNSTDTLETTFRQEAVNPNYVASGHLDLGVFAVIPESWSVIIDREVKMYTLVNALGFVGGIFGILVGVQTWLFGFRPRSPWGVVHRWSVGDMRRSLLRGLQDKFKTTEAGIPLIHPVHRRFSVNEFHAAEAESEEQRIERVEERMQTLELLFKAYYVDDEVFRSLDNANKSGPDVATATTTGRAMFPNSEKVDDASYNKPGFSHMFNNRQSVVSLNSDSTSQRHLNGRENVLMNDM
ncbi:hypothetical protein BDF14DRAFT_1776492 [Spinellus fusiger]|nr:hypothetical protein BDF14DRAFT_1776492 [Spinellus fusiger]